MSVIVEREDRIIWNSTMSSTESHEANFIDGMCSSAHIYIVVAYKLRNRTRTQIGMF